jgi:predicted oxidoreductase
MKVEVLDKKTYFRVCIDGRYLQIPKERLSEVVNVLEFWFLAEGVRNQDLAVLINLLTEKEHDPI